MMKTSRSKEAYRVWKAYQNSSIDAVWKAYRTRPSEAKEAAEMQILLEMVDAEGHDYRIISHSGFVFTCGYLVELEEGTALIYHTKTRREVILIDGEYRNGYTR